MHGFMRKGRMLRFAAFPPSAECRESYRRMPRPRVSHASATVSRCAKEAPNAIASHSLFNFPIANLSKDRRARTDRHPQSRQGTPRNFPAEERTAALTRLPVLFVVGGERSPASIA